ncbi:DUF2244 domain-containing protein [Nitrospirillum amazonense]|uniref:DUF2244 domain-containing protein n=1 Tax=Nitrospirillum amazonense TaxID=28077 RepID=UPI002DD4342C|nr:DUF2244 domain-containing protein [Nitrospirillum amazonense]MEC4589659.1 DUF2244 domain-containing protein [Nitrospirillum amazonense]
MPSDITAAAGAAAWTAPGQPVFDAFISPPVSLSDRGFLWFMGVVLAALCVLDLGLVLVGNWLVLAFLTGDVVFLLLAFVLYRHRAHRWERVRVAEATLVVERGRPDGGKGVVSSMPLFGLTLVRVRDSGGECRRLELRHRDRRLPFAADLTPQEREDFAESLGNSLHRAGFRVPLRNEIF